MAQPIFTSFSTSPCMNWGEENRFAALPTLLAGALARKSKKAHVYPSPETLGAREGARWLLGRQHGGA